MSQDDRERLIAIVDELSPSTLLVVGAVGADWLGTWLSEHTACQGTVLEDAAQLAAQVAAQLAATTDAASVPFDVAVLADDTASADWSRTAPVIATLRDRLSARLIVWVPTEATTELAAGDLIALGLTRVTDSASLYQFSLDTYKKTPDWLNARYWANPSQWNKRRW